MEIEFELNGAKLKCNENGDIWKWTTKQGRHLLKIPFWVKLKGNAMIDKTGYTQHRTSINLKIYTTSRVLFYAFYPNLFDINDPNITIDHIDRNSLNNHISNLRTATLIKQSQNRDYVMNAKGYFFRKRDNKWNAQISINGKKTFLGSFNTEEEASIAYQNAVIKYRS